MTRLALSNSDGIGVTVSESSTVSHVAVCLAASAVAGAGGNDCLCSNLIGLRTQLAHMSASCGDAIDSAEHSWCHRLPDRGGRQKARPDGIHVCRGVSDGTGNGLRLPEQVGTCGGDRIG